jgi:predicted Asp-tRNA(Asn)/Glu-tRNA(Gln) amidotransferase subunit C
MEQNEKEQIEKEAKQILEKFSKALASVKVKEGEEWNVEREEDRREEGEGVECENDFRRIMFENAPQKDDDFIIAEKKKW